jgi:hypothetical protein
MLKSGYIRLIKAIQYDMFRNVKAEIKGCDYVNEADEVRGFFNCGAFCHISRS